MGNRSWISDKARFDTNNGKAEFFAAAGAEEGAYTAGINKIIADKFFFSARMLETDYARFLFL
jgi:hypothetical protein